jgi:hypothetical protein
MKACYSVSVCVGGPGGPQIRLSERRSLVTRQTQVLLNSSRDHESNEIPTYVASSGFEWKEHQLRVSPGAPGQRKNKVQAAGGDLVFNREKTV